MSGFNTCLAISLQSVHLTGIPSYQTSTCKFFHTQLTGSDQRWLANDLQMQCSRSNCQREIFAGLAGIESATPLTDSPMLHQASSINAELRILIMMFYQKAYSASSAYFMLFDGKCLHTIVIFTKLHN